MTIQMNPVTRYVRSLTDRDYLLPKEAARALGITVERLKVLGRRFPERLGPGYVTWMGEKKIFLYVQEDLDQITAWFAEQERLSRATGRPDTLRGGRGRPPIWSADEHADRHRRRALVRYHHINAEQMEQRGLHERAERSRLRSAAMNDQLRAEREQRLASLGRGKRTRDVPAG